MNRDRLTLLVLFVATTLSVVLAIRLFLKKTTAVHAKSEIPFFMATVIDFSDSANKEGQRLALGLGASQTLFATTRAMSPMLTACREFVSADEVAATTFDVKVEPDKQRLRVVGILLGAEERPRLAACLRDKINSFKSPALGQLAKVDESAYRLRVEVRSGAGRDAP